MFRDMHFSCVLLACAFLFTHQQVGQADSSTEVRSIVRARVVHIPFATLTPKQGGSTASKPVNTLTVSAGGADEPPEGPAAFDVFDDGSLLIADPLRKRLVIFDARGKFLAELKIGFAADSLEITLSGLIQARQASTGDIHIFDRAGHSRPTGEVKSPQTSEARLLNDRSGTVTQPIPGGTKGPLDVRFDKPGLRLVSIESLGTDNRGNTYVALEATAGGEQVDVSKYVRKYSASGKVISEISDIPLDYYVGPVNELRVRKGVLYQMITTPSELQMNEWDVN